MKHLILICIVVISTTNLFAQLNLSLTSQQNTVCNGVGCNYEGPSILINEVMISPAQIGGVTIDGSMVGHYCGTTNPDVNQGEWIELYNPDICKPVDISCYFLGNNSSDGGTGVPTACYGGGYLIPPGTVVPPAGFVIVRGVNAPPVPSNLLVQNGGKTVELVINSATSMWCNGGGCRLWFPNAGGWFAFYDQQGVPQDAISWGDGTWSSAACFDDNPCLPTGYGCPFSGTLPHYDNIPPANKTFIYNQQIPNSLGQSFRRIPDGGSWVLNSYASATYGDCNQLPCAQQPIITCNGTATVTVTGGTPPYTYQWDDGMAQTTQTATGLCAGTYCVTVTDANNNTATGCINVTDLTLNVSTSFTNVSCYGGNDGTATVTANNGTSPYTYSWSTGQNTQTATGLSAGTYIGTVSDTNECIATDTVIISQPPQITIITSYTPTYCGQATGTATATASGGTPNYTYSWNTSPPQNTSTATGLSAGTYTVTVTDANNCTQTSTVTLTDTGSVTASFSPVNNQCLIGNSFNFTNTGTTGAGVTYSWSFPSATPSTSTEQNPSGVIWNTTGTYTVTQIVTLGGCVDTFSQNITLYPNPTATVDINSTCYGQCDGSATLTVTNGQPPYTYSWNTTPLQTTETATGLCAQTYTAIITDANQCTYSASANITLYPSPNADFIVSPEIGAPGEQITFNTISDTGITQWNWNFGDGTTEINNTSTTSHIYQNSGVYTVILEVTNQYGCTDTASYEIMIYHLEIPNIFTPNNDGDNEFFVISGLEGLKRKEIIIFNRWGNKVYESTNYQNDWDGKTKYGRKVPDGVYYFILKLPDINQEIYDFVTIIR